MQGIGGLNHLTLAVSDLDRSLAFYVDMLGCRPHCRWEGGAYLSAGETWLCLSLDDPIDPASDYTHYAFSVPAERFDTWAQRVRAAGVREWRRNVSEGDSLYLLDPDGHRLELHVGNRDSRLAAIDEQTHPGLQWLDR